MCGIVGFVGSKEAPQFVFNGLKRLEYRGYDSAGIACVQDRKVLLERASGKLVNLEPGLAKLPASAPVAIGHTRWATHGSPTVNNAHPHVADGEVALIHNGIIENYKELKAELVAKGAQIASETDSEIVAHLIAFELKKGVTPKQALSQVIARLHGAYALGIMFRSEPDALYCAKLGSPLVLGVGQGENYFSSDIMAFNGKTNLAIFLNDGECARITAKSFECWDSTGKTIRHEPTHFVWNAANIEKQGFRHYMLKEVHEQPSVIANTLERLLTAQGQDLDYEKLGLNKLDLKSIHSLQITACGTAYLAGMVGKYLIEPLIDLPIAIELASELRYRKPYLHKDTLMLAVSQSGETSDTLGTIKFAKERGCQVLSVCNVPYSSIARESHFTIHMEAGQEIGVASTKAFTAQILDIYLFGVGFAHKRGLLSSARVKEIIQELRTLPSLIDRALNQEEAIKALANKYYEYPNFLYVGRGPSFPLAMEGALKLKEISYIHAEGYAAGELKHGPIALVDRHMPIVAIVPRDEYYEKALSNVQEIAAREGQVIGIGAEKDEKFESTCSDYISCPSANNAAMQTIISSIPIQLLAYYIAVKRGTDVDQPRNLAKSVTVE